MKRTTLTIALSAALGWSAISAPADGVNGGTASHDAETGQTVAEPAVALPNPPTFQFDDVQWFVDAPLRAAMTVRLQGGEDCATAVALDALPVSVSGTTAGHDNDYDAVCPYGGSDAPDVVYAYTPAEDMLVDITLCAGPTDYDSKLHVYDACPPGPDSLVACNDDACVSSIGEPWVSELTAVELIAGTTYYIVVDGYAGAAGEYTLDVAAWAAGPTCPPGSLVSRPPMQRELVATFAEDWAPYGWDRLPELDHAITGIRFWGMTLGLDPDTGVWSPCEEDPLEVVLRVETFFHPQQTVCSHTVEVTGAPVGVVGAGQFTIYEYDIVLPEPCPARSDNMRIDAVGTYDDLCYLLWLKAAERPAVNPHDTHADQWHAWCAFTDGTPIVGACCDEFTGACVDGVAAEDCAGYLAPDTSCAALDPSCGAATGPCCLPGNECQTLTAAECAATHVCPGDLNCDGIISVADIDGFVIALTGGADGYYAAFPDCRFENADTNGDNTVSPADIDPFVQSLVSPPECSEPVWLGRDTYGGCDVCPGVAPPPVQCPADLPFTWSSSLCGNGNDFMGDCLTPADSGEDMEIELVVTEPATSITVSLERTGWWPTRLFGAAVLDGPIGVGTCVALAVTDEEELELGPIVLDPGTYTLVIDERYPDYHPCFNFDLAIASSTPIGRCCLPSDELPAPCEVRTEAACLADDGIWYVGEDCSTLCQPGPLATDGQDCAAALLIEDLPFVLDFPTAAYGADGPQSTCDRWGTTAPMPNDIWHMWTAPADTLVHARVSDAEQRAILAVRTACDGPEIACGRTSEDVYFNATAGQTYYFQIGTEGRWPVDTTRQFLLEEAPAQGACCLAAGGCDVMTLDACQTAGGTFIGYGVACGDLPCPGDPGATCADPIVADLDLSDPDVYYVDFGTTRNRGNDYSDTCLGTYDEGADVVYRFELPVATVLQFEVVAPYSGLLITDACPPDGDCIAVSPGAVENVTNLVTALELAAGVYYAVIDTPPWQPNLPSYEFRIRPGCYPSIAPVRGACCDANGCTDDLLEIECTMRGGIWYPEEVCSPTWCADQDDHGATCDDPIVIEIPDGFTSYEDDFGTTVGHGNNYDGDFPCFPISGGNDVVYALEVTSATPVCVTIELRDATVGSPWGGMALLDACAPGALCDFASWKFDSVELAPGTYYLVIDDGYRDWFERFACIPSAPPGENFSLVIERCD
jgi:hypothetical protein